MLSNYRKQVNEVKADRRVLLGQLEDLKGLDKTLELELTVREEAHAIIQKAAQVTQQSIEGQLGSVVTTALAAVFPDPYSFKVEFVSKRNTTECEFYFERNGNRTPPLSDSGFGAADIASVALKISYREMSKTRPILFMDEPCKNLSKDYQTIAAGVFRGLCEKLGLQMVAITHIPDFRQAADQLFIVEKDWNTGVSKLIKEN